MLNRFQRRRKQRALDKQFKNAKFDDFKDITDVMLKRGGIPKIGKFVGFYTNSIYSVQAYDKNGFILLGIARHDRGLNFPWSHKQKIKNGFLHKQGSAIEIFPPLDKEIDQVNMIWLWGGTKVNELVSSTGGLGTYKGR